MATTHPVQNQSSKQKQLASSEGNELMDKMQYNPEWYITAENRYLYYDDNDNECDEFEESIKDLQFEIEQLGNEIDIAQNIAYEMNEIKPRNTSINDENMEESFEPFYQDFMYHLQIQTEQLITENISLKSKLEKYERIIWYYFGFGRTNL
eukprot:472979_1